MLWNIKCAIQTLWAIREPMDDGCTIMLLPQSGGRIAPFTRGNFDTQTPRKQRYTGAPWTPRT